MSMNSPDFSAAVELIEHFEGCLLHAYRDPVGIWTIGFGHTKNVKPGTVISKQKALELLETDMQECADAILKSVKVPVTTNEICALVSFAFNVGIGALKGSTLLRKLNAGRPHQEVADEFLKWIHAGGRVLPGLVRRRKAERELFLASQNMMESA
jgi:lysozyme